jgi:Binding-protein-dependent transport system inner membrane component
MSFLIYAWNWLRQPAQWHGADAIPARVLEQLGYAGLALLIAVVIALPLGVAIGHTGRGAFLAVSLTSAWRSVPTLGLLVLLVVVLGFSALTWLVPLVVLGIPPILVNIYEGVAGVDPDLRDAAAGVGMTRWQQVLRVEVPVALPLIIVGLRTAAILHRPRRPGPLHIRRPGQQQLWRGRRGRRARGPARARGATAVCPGAAPGRAGRAPDARAPFLVAVPSRDRRKNSCT